MYVDINICNIYIYLSLPLSLDIYLCFLLPCRAGSQHLRSCAMIIHSTTSWRTKEWNRATQEEEETAKNRKGRPWISIRKVNRNEGRVGNKIILSVRNLNHAGRGRAWSTGLEGSFDAAEKQQKVEAHGMQLFGKRSRHHVDIKITTLVKTTLMLKGVKEGKGCWTSETLMPHNSLRIQASSKNLPQ